MLSVEPITVAGRAGWSAIVADPGLTAFAFDFDGTLAPIVDDPEQARIHPRCRAALARLAPLVGSMAIITGRPVAVVVDRAGLRSIPELSSVEIFGHYGAERWDGRTGQVIAPMASTAVAAARLELAGLLAGLALPAGVMVEDKGGALAVHTRRSAEPHAALAILARSLPAFAQRHGLVIEPGRLVLELRPPGVDKGAALRAFVAERGATRVVFVGDDLGDLSAFAVVEELRAAGIAGVKIGSGSPEVTEVALRADLVVDGPAGVADLVNALADTLTR